MMKKSKKIITGVTAVALASIIGISGLFAYFTAQDSLVNQFTVGDGDTDEGFGLAVDLREPLAEQFPDENDNDIPDPWEDLDANEKVIKDPKVFNIGELDEYVYLQVFVPRAKVATDDVVTGNTVVVSGTMDNRKEQDLFTYTVNQNWKLINSKVVIGDGNNSTVAGQKYTEYIYAYTKDGSNMAVLKGSGVDGQVGTESTNTLFDTVRLINLHSDELGINTDVNIPIYTYAIQTTSLGETDSIAATTKCEAVWKILCNTNEGLNANEYAFANAIG